MVLSLSPGLGPDGLPSPGGYFPHVPTNGSGNNGLNGGAAGGGGSAGGDRGSISGGSGNVGLAVSGINSSAVRSPVQALGGAAMQGNMGNGSCNSNNPSPVMMMGAQNSHRSSPCNELLAAAMRSSHATNAAGENCS